MEYVKSLRDAA